MATSPLLLAFLSERLRAYRQAIGDLGSEERCRIAVCAVLERLLGECLAGRQDWESGAWVDGILPGRFEVGESGDLTLTSLAVWHSRGKVFLAPFAASVEVSPDGETVSDYSLCFGDARVGLRKFPYSVSSKHCYDPLPTDWCFQFTGDMPG